MKVVVAGSRNDRDCFRVFSVLNKHKHRITEVVSGGATGPDTFAVTWAKRSRLPCKIFLPDWKQFAKAAGPRRNAEMALYADELIAFWDGISAGTGNMIRRMQVLKKPITYIRYDAKDEAACMKNMMEKGERRRKMSR